MDLKEGVGSYGLQSPYAGQGPLGNCGEFRELLKSNAN
jgi:hypothetical protein